MTTTTTRHYTSGILIMEPGVHLPYHHFRLEVPKIETMVLDVTTSDGRRIVDPLSRWKMPTDEMLQHLWHEFRLKAETNNGQCIYASGQGAAGEVLKAMAILTEQPLSVRLGDVAFDMKAQTWRE